MSIQLSDIQERQKEIIEHYGYIEQLDRLVEECSELIQAICKYKRKGEYDDFAEIDADLSLMEEMADVENLIEQFKIHNIDIEKNIEKEKGWKINRELGRIVEELESACMEEDALYIIDKFDL
ncbi:MAG: hypothetical protein GX974_03995 [Clostridiales bacterium]|nr:hypothetical protein [Clostridiales bacterium]